jgi:hypothetical protein
MSTFPSWGRAAVPTVKVMIDVFPATMVGGSNPTVTPSGRFASEKPHSAPLGCRSGAVSVAATVAVVPGNIVRSPGSSWST